MGWFQNAYNNVFNAPKEEVKSSEPSTWSKVKSGASTAWNWTKETAAPAVGNAALYVAAWTPPGLIMGGMGMKWSRDRIGNTVEFGKYAASNPARAGALATQGIINAASSTVGLVADIAHSSVDAAVTLTANRAISLYNLGAANNQKIAKWEFRDFGTHGDSLNKTLQIRNIPGLENSKAFARIDPADKNASYERVLLYGPQAVAEVGIFWVTAAATAGVGAAALATVRGTSVATRAAEAAKLAEKAAKLAETAKAGETTAKTANTVNTAGQTAGNQAATQTAQTGAKTGQTVVQGQGSTASASTTQASAQTAQTSNVTGLIDQTTTVTNTAAANARTVSTTTTPTRLTGLTPVNAGVTQVAQAGTQAANATVAPMGYAQYVGYKAGELTAKTWKLFDPRHGNWIGARGLEVAGAGVAFGMGVYTDIEQGKKEIADAKKIGDTGAAAAIGGMAETLRIAKEKAKSADQTPGADLNALMGEFQSSATGNTPPPESAADNAPGADLTALMAQFQPASSGITPAPESAIPPQDTPRQAEAVATASRLPGTLGNR